MNVYLIAVALGALALAASTPAVPQADATVQSETVENRLFVIEITVGPAWDASKPPSRQGSISRGGA